MKRLADAAQEYLALRRALGFKLRHETWWLPDFVSFLKRHRSSIITTELALRWAQQPPHAASSWWAKRLGAIRSFARHHLALDPRTEVPPPDLLPYRGRHQTPYIYSDKEICALVQKARCLPLPLQSATYATLIGLLAVTGMRVGEALALKKDDVDWGRSLLTVRHGKFQKSRHVPVHRSVLAALRGYSTRRDGLLRGRQSSSFFVSTVGTRVFEQNFGFVFRRLLQGTGVGAGNRRRPRVHDLRHSFAVKTLRNWYRAGVDVERRLPSLSTYLGHVAPSTTYWYLTATPELLALASKRAERAWKVRP
jgi:integrase